MSITGNYRRATPAELESLIRVPAQIVNFVYPAEETEPDPDRHLDIDKAWDPINFLLTGGFEKSKPPFGNVVLGGHALGDVDVGCGPARYLTPKEVIETAAALRTVPWNELQRRIDPVEMKTHYPHWCWEDDLEYELEYLQLNYVPLVEFFQTAAKAGDGMILYFN